MAQEFLAKKGKYFNKMKEGQVSQKVGSIERLYNCNYVEGASWQERASKESVIKLPMEFLE